jgi:CRP-like cAMP-binding protein
VRDAVVSSGALRASRFAPAAWRPPPERRARGGGEAGAGDAQCEPLLTSREREAVQQSRWFAALPLLLRHDLLRRCTVRRYRCGEAVRADVSGRVQLDAVACGAVAVSRCNPEAAAFDYLPAGTWLVDPGSLARGERTQRVVAHGHATIVSVNAADLAAVMGVHEVLANSLLRLSHERMLEHRAILDELSSLDLQARLESWLRRLCARFGEDDPRGVRIALDLKQDELAELVRASRARVNLHLKAMERSGIVAVERRLVVTDPKALGACRL